MARLLTSCATPKQGQAGRRLLMAPEDSRVSGGDQDIASRGSRRRLLADPAEEQAVLHKLAEEHKERLAAAQAGQPQQQQHAEAQAPPPQQQVLTPDQQQTAQQLERRELQEQRQLHQGAAASGQQSVDQGQQGGGQGQQAQGGQQADGVFAEEAGQVQRDGKPAGTQLGAENAASNELTDEVLAAALPVSVSDQPVAAVLLKCREEPVRSDINPADSLLEAACRHCRPAQVPTVDIMFVIAVQMLTRRRLLCTGDGDVR